MLSMLIILSVTMSRFTELVEDVDLLIRRAERCLEAGADMIMIDADDVCTYADSLRTDIIAKIIGRLGLEKTMFEASNANTSEWFVKRYGPRVCSHFVNFVFRGFLILQTTLVYSHFLASTCPDVAFSLPSHLLGLVTEPKKSTWSIS